MKFLVNPMASVRRHGKPASAKAFHAAGFTRNPKRKRRKRKLTGAALTAHLRKLNTRHRKAGTRRRPSTRKGITMKRKRTRSTRRRRTRVARRRRTFAANPPRRIRRRSRRRFRRNPGTVKGLIGMATQGLKDAAGVVVGKTAARALPQVLGLPQAGAMGLGIQAVAALVVGYGASRFLGHDVGRMVLAGGLAAPLESAVKQMNIPIVSAALSAYPLGAYPGEGLGAGTGTDVANIYTGMAGGMGDADGMEMY